MKSKTELFISTLVIAVVFILIIILGVNVVNSGQKNVDLYQKYLYSNDR